MIKIPDQWHPRHPLFSNCRIISSFSNRNPNQDQEHLAAFCLIKIDKYIYPMYMCRDRMPQLHMRCHVAIKVSGFISALFRSSGAVKRMRIGWYRIVDRKNPALLWLLLFVFSVCCLRLPTIRGSQLKLLLLPLDLFILLSKCRYSFPTWNCSRIVGKGGLGLHRKLILFLAPARKHQLQNRWASYIAS